MVFEKHYLFLDEFKCEEMPVSCSSKVLLKTSSQCAPYKRSSSHDPHKMTAPSASLEKHPPKNKTANEKSTMNCQSKFPPCSSEGENRNFDLSSGLFYFIEVFSSWAQPLLKNPLKLRSWLNIQRQSSKQKEHKPQETVTSRKQTLNDSGDSGLRRDWLLWMYEREQMIPDTKQRVPDIKTLSRQEKVNSTDLEEYLQIEPRMRCHQHADSLFSTSSGFTNYRGVLNWLIVLSLCAMGRVALENVIKYGILINPLSFLEMFLENPYEWTCLRLIILLNVFILLIYGMECLLAKGYISESGGFVINSATLVSIVVIPGAVVFTIHPNPLFSSVTLGIHAITFLKLVSYVQVNSWCRASKHFENHSKRRRMQSMSSANLQDFTNGGIPGISRELVIYPNNLTLNDLYYYILAPTLCYELNFPRSERIRKRFLIKRVIEIVILTGIVVGLVQQWIVPLVLNSQVCFQELDLGKMLERLLKLAVPNHLIWLIFFYWFFHSCLNTLAEVLRFGDRIFYRDWWNAEHIKQFWQNWNIPVHRWAIRHLYKPMVTAGYSSHLASIAVFMVSAFFHEYLVSVPLRMFRLWAFSAMLGQVPLAYLTQYMDQKIGNIIVWLSLILGQPTAILMYYHDYFLLNHNGVV